MTKLYITEYARQALDNHGQPIAAGEEPALATQVVDYNAGAAASAAFNAKTRLVRLHNDSICSIRFAAAPVAVVTDPRMAAGQTEYFGVLPELVATGLKVSAVTNT